jgi:hypothetical protein
MMDFDRELKKCDELMERLWDAEETITRLKEEVKDTRGTLALEKRLTDMSIKQQAERRRAVEILREMRDEEREPRRKAALSHAIAAVNLVTQK